MSQWCCIEETQRIYESLEYTFKTERTNDSIMLLIKQSEAKRHQSLTHAGGAWGCDINHKTTFQQCYR